MSFFTDERIETFVVAFILTLAITLFMAQGGRR